MEPPIVETPQPTVSKQSSQKLLLVVSGAVLLFAVAAGLFLMNQKPPMDDPTPTPIATATPQPTEEPTACTMDAKICPDGSSVGRVAPSCEFEACPGETSVSSTEVQTFSNDKLGFTLELPGDWPTLVMKSASESASFVMTLQNPRGNENEHLIFSIIFRKEFDLGPGPFYEKMLAETPEGVYIFRGTHEGVSSNPEDTTADTINFEKFPPNEELFEVVKANFVLL